MTRILIVAALSASSSVATAQAVTVTLSEFKLGLGRDTVRAGSVTFNVKNSGTMNHAFYVRGEGVAKGTKDIPAGQEAPLTVTLKPGTSRSSFGDAVGCVRATRRRDRHACRCERT